MTLFKEKDLLRRKRGGKRPFKILVLLFPHFVWNKTWKQSHENGWDNLILTKSGMQPNTCGSIIIIWKDY